MYRAGSTCKVECIARENRFGNSLKEKGARHGPPPASAAQAEEERPASAEAQEAPPGAPAQGRRAAGSRAAGPPGLTRGRWNGGRGREGPALRRVYSAGSCLQREEPLQEHRD